VVRLFRVDPERRTEFEGIYGAGGLWSDLCRRKQGFFASSMKPLVASSEFFECAERWQTHWDWEAFCRDYRAECERIAGFAREQKVVLGEQMVGAFYHYDSGPDDSEASSTPA